LRNFRWQPALLLLETPSMIHRVKLGSQPVRLAGLAVVALALACSESNGTASGTPSRAGLQCDIVRVASFQRSPGTKALGMKGGQFLIFETNARPQVDVWLTVAQALLQNEDPLGVLPATEKFNRSGAGPIKGLWAKPA